MQTLKESEELVLANHILARHKVLDGYGHVSVRAAEDPQTFRIARSMAPALVAPVDIMRLDFESEPCDGDDRTPFLERFIHAEIYRARPDVMAIVHSHSPAVIPFSVSKTTPLRPVCHMCGYLGSKTPVFEIRDAGGPETDMLVRDKVLGRALAESLGESAVVLMRGHGSTTVGKSLREAVFRAIYAEVNARLQMDALRLGEIEYLNEAEAAKSAAVNEAQSGRAWELWVRELG